jgi:hypothetical protein
VREEKRKQGQSLLGSGKEDKVDKQDDKDLQRFEEIMRKIEIEGRGEAKKKMFKAAAKNVSACVLELPKVRLRGLYTEEGEDV